MEFVAETDRLLLKVFEKSDLEASERFWGNPEVMNHSGGATPLNVLPQVLEAYQKRYIEKRISVFAVIEKTSGQVIGAAGFNTEDGLEKVELLYHFAKASWGKGYATEAVHACLELAVNHPLVETVCASAAPGNKASIRILEKAGFRFTEMKFFEDTQQLEPVYEITAKMG
ncbi:GNAT family N-acetyltransferase [Planococcus shixiaomingii]|uniref:GNAT family N-acetyltransferase n=1 Tax=Planococcus shixiaomingii TaxID=3058393 RepID=UPI00261C4C94|nr:GNAT family N-acetyltransferase [Planococcus sp. N022]WKA53037.1 GNAT family N-acetyltransferase [Planococcus sp. N022]